MSSQDYDASVSATELTLTRIETVIGLLVRAGTSAASIRAAASSDHDRLRAAVLNSTLEDALAEQQILWLELAPTAASGQDGRQRYRDVNRSDERLPGRTSSE